MCDDDLVRRWIALYLAYRDDVFRWCAKWFFRLLLVGIVFGIAVNLITGGRGG